MSFREAAGRVFQRWGRYSGRATRLEYFLTYAFAWAGFIGTVFFVLTVFGDDSPASVLSGVAYLVAAQAIHAALVRRLHDTGRSGWWTLPPLGGLVALVLLFASDEDGENKYGTPHDF